MRTFAQKPNVPEKAAPAKSATRDRAHLDRAHLERSAEVNEIEASQPTLENQSTRSLLQAKTQEWAPSLGGAESTRFAHDFSLIPVNSRFGVNPRVSPRSLRSAGTLLKVAMGGSEDTLEQEADRVADQVTSAPSSGFEPPGISVANVIAPQRHRTSYEGVGMLDRNKTGGPRGVPPIVDEVLHTSGQPLDPNTRAFMEPRFGYDFSKVRVHADHRPAMSASAIGAQAYTWGNSIVFGRGQHRPDTKEGRHLVAHELAHVVQQAQQPSGMIRRKATKDDEDKKKQRVAHHEKQQRLVAGFLADALKIKPKAPKGPLDPDKLDSDTLFHNTAQLVDPPQTAKARLIVLTPTHYSTHDAPVYFDAQVAHPNLGKDYPADPAERVTADGPGSGLTAPSGLETAGQTGLPAPPPQTGLSTIPKRDEDVGERIPYKESTDPHEKPAKPAKAPAAASPAAVAPSPAEIKLFLGKGDGKSTADITLDEFKNTLVHEGQHVSDLHYLEKINPADWKSVLERYKSEYRAFSIQPPQSDFGKSDPIDSSTVQPSIGLGSGDKCEACGGTASTPTTRMIGTKNKRQDRIFWNLISNYPQERFGCFYICNDDFYKAVNRYDTPSSINLVNSTRLVDLNIAVRQLTPGMTGAEVAKTNLQSAIENLDATDWAFLKSAKISDPFWTSLKDLAPTPLFKAIQDLASAGTPSATHIRKSLKEALAKLK